jgi:hypothetical protein
MRLTCHSVCCWWIHAYFTAAVARSTRPPFLSYLAPPASGCCLSAGAAVPRRGVHPGPACPGAPPGDISRSRYGVRIPVIVATQSGGKLPPNPEEGCHLIRRKVATHSRGKLPPHRSAATPRVIRLHCQGFLCQCGALFSHRFSSQSNVVGVMNQTVKDGIGQSGVPNVIRIPHSMIE